MIKLFCLPYAGGSAMMYNRWGKYLDPGIKLMPVELAGRGRRIDDAFYCNRQQAVDDVFRLIEPQTDTSPYAIFGHSLGAMIAYEVVQKIRLLGLPAPQHSFFSGQGAPHVIPPEKKIYHLMNEASFKKELIELGGTPPEFFEYPEMLDVFLPLLRNDFMLAETDNYTNEPCPLDGNITIFMGKDDSFNAEECDGWKRHTKRLCSTHYFEGGHFFLHDSAEQMVKLINHALSKSY